MRKLNICNIDTCSTLSFDRSGNDGGDAVAFADAAEEFDPTIGVELVDVEEAA
jgi:hypothetical protein